MEKLKRIPGPIIVILTLLANLVIALVLWAEVALFNIPMNVDYWEITEITFSVTFIATSLLGGLADKSEKIYWITYPEEKLINSPLNFLVLSSISYCCLGIEVLIALLNQDSSSYPSFSKSLMISSFVLAIAAIIYLSHLFTAVYFIRKKYLKIYSKKFKTILTEGNNDKIRQVLLSLYNNSITAIEEHSYNYVVENVKLLIPEIDNDICRNYLGKIIISATKSDIMILPEILSLIDTDAEYKSKYYGYILKLNSEINKFAFNGDIEYEAWEKCDYILEETLRERFNELAAKFDRSYDEFLGEGENQFEIQIDLENQIFDYISESAQACELLRGRNPELLRSVLKPMVSTSTRVSEVNNAFMFRRTFPDTCINMTESLVDYVFENMERANRYHDSKELAANAGFLLDVANDYFDIETDNHEYELVNNGFKNVIKKLDNYLTELSDIDESEFKSFLGVITQNGYQDKFYIYAIEKTFNPEVLYFTYKYDEEAFFKHSSERLKYLIEEDKKSSDEKTEFMLKNFINKCYSVMASENCNNYTYTDLNKSLIGFSTSQICDNPFIYLYDKYEKCDGGLECYSMLFTDKLQCKVDNNVAEFSKYLLQKLENDYNDVINRVIFNFLSNQELINSILDLDVTLNEYIKVVNKVKGKVSVLPLLEKLKDEFKEEGNNRLFNIHFRYNNNLIAKDEYDLQTKDCENFIESYLESLNHIIEFFKNAK